MYKIRRLNYSMSSVLSGIKSLTKRGITAIRRLHGLPLDRSATFTSRYIKTSIVHHHGPPPPWAMGITFCGNRPRIQYATSLAIFTATVPPRPQVLFAPLGQSLLPLSVPMYLLHPYLPHFMSTKASRRCRRLTTSTPLIRQPSKAPEFPSPHRIEPPLVQYWTLSPPQL
ncbi:hypothetical protein EDB92DRAFT_1867526 [Lactarius akahatsu]|uniref:Uncharacterized protein n=1 Tax=Lactarius akahatsu TaxID=416441 RepID=A0AAD4QCT6_9AGAM|nr:hypothetical protein EDB92DRAFT_1867526 [Lactarius akahatsu]